MKKLVGILAAVLLVVSVFAATPVTIDPYVEGSVTGSVTLGNEGIKTALDLNLKKIGWGYSVDGLSIDLSVDVEAGTASVSKLGVANDDLGLTWYASKKLDSSKYQLGWFSYFDNGAAADTMVLDLKALNLSLATQDQKVAVKADVPVLDGNVNVVSQVTTASASLTDFDKAGLEVTASDLLAGLTVGAGVQATDVASISLDTLEYYVEGSYEYAVPAEGMAVTVTPRAGYATDGVFNTYFGVNLDVDADAYFATLDVAYDLPATTLELDLKAGLTDWFKAHANVNMVATTGSTPTVAFLVVSDPITVYGPVSATAKVGTGHYTDANWGRYDKALNGDIMTPLATGVDVSAELSIEFAPELGLEVLTGTSVTVTGDYYFGDDPAADYAVELDLDAKLYDLLDLNVNLGVLPEFTWAVTASYSVSF